MGTVGNLSTTLYIGPRKPLLDGAEITGEGSAIAALVAAYEIAVFNATPTKPTTSPGG
jgi:hypothetical protein